MSAWSDGYVSDIKLHVWLLHRTEPQSGGVAVFNGGLGCT